MLYRLATVLLFVMTGSAAADDPVRDALAEDRALRRRHADAEAQYERESITLGHVYTQSVTDGTSSDEVTHTLVPYKNNRRLDSLALFHAVGRGDLVARYHRRREVGTVVGVVGLATLAVASYIIVAKGIPNQNTCDFFSAGYDACQKGVDDRAAKHRNRGLILGGAGLVAAFVGGYFIHRANPLSETEMHDLVDNHNARLRKRLVGVAPYATPDGGGLAVAGRF